MTTAYQLRNISFQYGNKTVLSIADLNITAQQRLAVVGSNGSGKSTLLRILAFLQYPNAGQIYFFDVNSSQIRKKKLREQVGWLAQSPYLLRGTVKSNIELALKLRKKTDGSQVQQVNNVLEQLEIAHLADQPINQLSGGEKQKTALARTLVLTPDILILDEPFSFLDENSIRVIESIIAAYPKTIIFSTHDRLKGQALADQILVLVDGKPVQRPELNAYKGIIKQGHFVTKAI